MKKLFLVGLALLAVSAAIAEEPPPRLRAVRRGWEFGLWFPPGIPHQSTVDPAVFRAALSDALVKSPDVAPYICGAVTEWPKHLIPNPGFKDPFAPLVAISNEVCRSVPVTPEQAKMGSRLISPFYVFNLHDRMYRDHYQVFLSHWSRVLDNLGLYAPPPASADEWRNGGPAGRDYETDLRAEFDRDPLLGAVVCSRMEWAEPPADAVMAGLHEVALKVCAEIPDQRVLARAELRNKEVAAKQKVEVATKLRGILNTALDMAKLMTDDERAHEVDRLMGEELPGMSPGAARFQHSLSLIALHPDGFRELAAVLSYASEAGANSPEPVAQMSDVDALLDAQYAARTQDPAGVAAQRARGRRNLLLLRGDLKGAAAVELRGVDASDRIFNAVLARAMGDRKPYDALMAHCPAPDRAFLLRSSKPLAGYCETLVAEISKLVARRMPDGGPPALAEMLVETNRALPEAARKLGTVPSPTPAQTRIATLEKLTGMLRSESEAARALTDAERRQAVSRISEEWDLLNPNVEPAVKAVAMEPERSYAVASLVASLPASVSSEDPEQLTRLKALFLKVFEANAAKGPERPRWRRGLRSYLMFTGDYVRAGALAHEIAADKDEHYLARDVSASALLDWINGDEAPYRKLLSPGGCPHRSAVDQPNEPADEAADPAVFCRSVNWWDARRIVHFQQRKTPLAAQQVLVDLARRTTYREELISSLDSLGEASPELAEREWLAVLSRPRLSDEFHINADYGLAAIAEEGHRVPEAIRRIEDILKVIHFREPGFPHDGWKLLKNAPEQNGDCMVCNDAVNALRRLGDLAIKNGDFKRARQVIEWLLPLTLNMTDHRDVRERLMALATAELVQGQIEEPTRILGYLSTQPLDVVQSARLKSVRERLGAGANVAPRDSPWDTAERAPARHEPPPEDPTLKV